MARLPAFVRCMQMVFVWNRIKGWERQLNFFSTLWLMRWSWEDLNLFISKSCSRALTHANANLWIVTTCETIWNCLRVYFFLFSFSVFRLLSLACVRLCVLIAWVARHCITAIMIRMIAVNVWMQSRNIQTQGRMARIFHTIASRDIRDRCARPIIIENRLLLYY